MLPKTRRAGAFASAAMMLATLFAVDGSGAQAQTEMAQTEMVMPVALLATNAAEAQDAAANAAAPDDTIRFVASPIIQDLTQEIAAADAMPAVGEHASLHALVDATPAGGELAGEIKCLAQAVYFEARGEPLDGQLAVARVVVNRSASGKFPSDYCSVVTQRSQFSFVRGGRIPSANERSAAWSRAVRIARIAHQDLWPSEVGDALYFHAGRVRPSWAGRKVTMAQIDRHVFYR